MSILTSATWFALIASLLLKATVTYGSPAVSLCLDEYINDIGTLEIDKTYIKSLKSYAERLKIAKPIKSQVKLVLDVGLGSMGHSQVLNHAMQLNANGFDHLDKSITTCKYDTKVADKEKFRELLRSSPEKPLYVSGKNPYPSPGAVSWLDLLDSHKNIQIIMNDQTDAEYLNNQFLPECTDPDAAPELKCFAPLFQLVNTQTPPQSLLLSRLSFEALKPYLTAYRRLIRCAEPLTGKKLYTVNLKGLESAYYHYVHLQKYFETKVSPDKIKPMIKGIHHPMAYHNHCRGEDCSGSTEMLVSVCPSVEFEMPPKLHKKMSSCALAYSDEIGAIFGQQYRQLVFDKLMVMPTAPQRASADTRRLILGVGPGTTGTRSLYLSMIMLNISARHHFACSHNCAGSLYDKRIDNDMKFLSEEPEHRHLLWTDTPVMDRWWNIFKMYPKSRIVMTDVRNESAWRQKRIAEFCQVSKVENWENTCIAPLPVGYFKEESTKQSVNFFMEVQLKKISEEAHRRAWDAYRGLIRCVVPEEQLTWLYMSEQSDSAAFWSTIIRAANTTVHPKVRDALVAAGVPKWSFKGCWIGKTACSYNGGPYDEMVTPSVCSVQV